MLFKKTIATTLLSGLVALTIAQETENWQHKDPTRDLVQGTSVDRAYSDFLKDKEAKKTVVVAILDSGVDIEHEDLQGRIWTNEDEIPGNGIDDDNNGYIDDIHGWNFLGGADSALVVGCNMEYVRLLNQLEDNRKRTKEEQDLYEELSEQWTVAYKAASNNLEEIAQIENVYQQAQETVLDYLGTETYSLDDVKSINTEDETVATMATLLVELESAGIDQEEIDSYKEYLKSEVDFHLNRSFKPEDIIGDDPSNINETGYGNNDVIARGADHGTHVAGIVAAVRDNEIGMDGIASNVEIMAVRMVPDGDERDKDVANGIRYAVANGADIINMSFGKGYSPNSADVQAAILEAEKAGVLLVHAAGNSHQNNDDTNNFPRYPKDQEPKTWIEVGASDQEDGLGLTAPFSNYGSESVHVFAPGVDIYSTIPGNEYASFNGTSMASPVVAGVAALVWSYYPDLTAEQLRVILLESATDHNKTKVYLPASTRKKKSKLGKLCVTGGVINALQALEMAEQMSK